MTWEELQILGDELEEHRRLVEALYQLAQADHAALRRRDAAALRRHGEARREMLPRLTGANQRLSQHRIRWERLPRESRDPGGRTAQLVRRGLESILRTVMLEQANERHWPRMRPPAPASRVMLPPS